MHPRNLTLPNGRYWLTRDLATAGLAFRARQPALDR